MRIWLVPFGELDDARVVAQHNEIHAIHSIITRNHSWLDWHYTCYREALYDVHTRIVAEMAQRGFTDYTPLEPDEHDREIIATYPQLPYTPQGADLDIDRWDLVSRWGGEYKGRVEPPDAYNTLIKAYRDEGGCKHNGPIRRVKQVDEKGRRLELCGTCKKYLRVKGTNDWFRAPKGQGRPNW